MRLFLDENTSSSFIKRGLAADGHEVWTALELNMAGADDRSIIQKAGELACILIARDDDMEQIACSKRFAVTAMVLKHPAPQFARRAVLTLIRDLLKKYRSELEAGQTLIWSESGVEFC